MESSDIKAIIKTRFPESAEKLVYCVHCLNPFLATISIENETLIDQGLGAGLEPTLRTGEILFRTFPRAFAEPPEIRRREHQCPDCAHWNNPENHRPGTAGEAFPGDSPDVICCPNCLLPIHRGEGPYTAEAYRAELLRRATGGAFRIGPETFEGPSREPEAGAVELPEIPLAMRIERDLGSWAKA